MSFQHLPILNVTLGAFQKKRKKKWDPVLLVCKNHFTSGIIQTFISQYNSSDWFLIGGEK